MNKMTLTDSIEECFITIKKGEIYRFIINHTEKALIEKALERTDGNQLIASKILGLNRNTLRTKIRKLNINMERFK